MKQNKTSPVHDPPCSFPLCLLDSNAQGNLGIYMLKFAQLKMPGSRNDSTEQSYHRLEHLPIDLKPLHTVGLFVNVQYLVHIYA